jgi:hypothetical protein
VTATREESNKIRGRGEHKEEKTEGGRAQETKKTEEQKEERRRVCTAKQRTQHHRRLHLSIIRYEHFPSQSLQQK